MNRTKLLVLHGALGSSSQMHELIELLSDSFFVKSFDFSGHGGKAFEDAFGIDQFASELAEFLLEEDFEDCFIFGYSMGAYVALKYLLQNKTKVKGLFSLGTKMRWSPEIAQHEIKQLQPRLIEEKVPKFASILAQRHAPNSWQELVEKTAKMMLELGDGKALSKQDLETIKLPACVALADDDNMVSEEESIWAANCLSARYLKILDAKHPIERVPLDTLAQEIEAWVSSLKNS